MSFLLRVFPDRNILEETLIESLQVVLVHKADHVQPLLDVLPADPQMHLEAALDKVREAVDRIEKVVCLCGIRVRLDLLAAGENIAVVPAVVCDGGSRTELPLIMLPAFFDARNPSPVPDFRKAASLIVDAAENRNEIPAQSRLLLSSSGQDGYASPRFLFLHRSADVGLASPAVPAHKMVVSGTYQRLELPEVENACPKGYLRLMAGLPDCRPVHQHRGHSSDMSRRDLRGEENRVLPSRERPPA